MADDDILINQKFNDNGLHDLDEPLVNSVKLASADFGKGPSNPPPNAPPLPPPTRCYKRRVNICGQKYSIWRFRRATDTIACTFLVLGAIFLVLAFALPAGINSILTTTVATSLAINNRHTDSYGAFEELKPDSDTPVHYDIYIFDVVNSNEVMCNGPGGPYDPRRDECPGSVPDIVERGPYAYKKLWRRFDVSWSDHGEKISYIEQDYYIWDNERAGPGLSETDMLTSPSLAANLVKGMLEEYGGTASDIRAGSKQIADAFRKFASSPESDLTEFGSEAEIEHAALAIEKLGDTVGEAMSSIPLNGDGWRLLLKLILCAAPPAGPSQFHTRPMKDLYWGYWGDPLLKFLGTIIVATGNDFVSYLPGFATNYSTEADARRQANGPTVLHTGQTIQKIHNYVLYMGMEYYYVCLAPDYSTGSEVDQIPAVCPQFDLSWTVEEAAANGYFPPWHTPEEVPITGFGDCEGFHPFHGRPYPGGPATARREEHKVFISDISRSFPLKHESTYTWRGVELHRLQIREQDMATSNCTWEYPAGSCNPDNAQYDAFGPSGMLNMTTLSGGVQIFASKPHFLDGHPWLVNQFKGSMKPRDEIHQTFLDIEPFTGDPFRLAERLQLVMKVDNWHLPSVRLSDYFGWNTTAEREVVAQGLESVYILVRDAAAKGVEAKIEDKLFGEGGICPTSSEKHFERCEATAQMIEAKIYHLLQNWCNESSSTSMPIAVPVPAPSAAPAATPVSTSTKAPTSIPSSSPSAIPVSAPTAAALEAENEERLLARDYPIPTLPAFNATGQDLICDVIDWGWDTIIEPHKIAELIAEGRAFCAANPATCEQFEVLAAQQLQEWLNSKCGGDDIDSKTAAECKLGQIAFDVASSVFEVGANFCNSGVCEAVEYVVDFLNGTSLVEAKDNECALLKKNREQHCKTINDYVDDLIATECVKNTNWTVQGHTVTAQKVCEIAHEIVYENDFDDKNANDWWGDDVISLPHGVFWKKADAFCTKNRANKAECSLVRGAALAELSDICADHTSECEVAKYIIENWEPIDGIIVNVTHRYEDWCESDICTALGVDPNPNGPIQQSVTAKLLEFCGVESFSSNGTLPPAPLSEHPWINLAKACPTIVNEVKTAIAEYCGDDTQPIHGIECSIIQTIPWDTPVTDDSGPILALIEEAIVPAIQGDVAKIQDWCAVQPDATLPDWHKEICQALGPLVLQEFEDLFNAAVKALDALVPQFNISGVVTTAEEYMVCALGEATSPGIDSEGYFFPLAWADEWVEVPREDTRLVKDDVYGTQMAAHQIEVSFLIISGCFVFLACFIVLIRRYTKSDYEAEDRLLHRELVARKDISDPFDFSPLVAELDEDEDVKNPLSSDGAKRGPVATGNAWV